MPCLGWSWSVWDGSFARSTDSRSVFVSARLFALEFRRHIHNLKSVMRQPSPLRSCSAWRSNSENRWRHQQDSVNPQRRCRLFFLFFFFSNRTLSSTSPSITLPLFRDCAWAEVMGLGCLAFQLKWQVQKTLSQLSFPRKETKRWSTRNLCHCKGSLSW